MMLWLFGVSVAHAACTDPVTTEELDARLGRAEEAFSGSDADGFFVAMGEARTDVVCLSEVVSTSTAGRMHRLGGLLAYARGDTDAAVTSFAGANAVDPTGTLASGLVPEGHELWTLVSTPSPADDGQRLPLPARGVALFVDGVPGRVRPTLRPTIFQVATYGTVGTTVLLSPDDPVPVYPVSMAPRNRRRGALVAAGASFVTSAVLYGLALDAGGPVRSGSVPDGWTRDDVIAAQGRANGLTLGASGAATLGIGLVIGAAAL